jgi:hypothetical protein
MEKKKTIIVIDDDEDDLSDDVVEVVNPIPPTDISYDDDSYKDIADNMEVDIGA